MNNLLITLLIIFSIFTIGLGYYYALIYDLAENINTRKAYQHINANHIIGWILVLVGCLLWILMLTLL